LSGEFTSLISSKYQKIGENTIRFLCKALDGDLDLSEVKGIAYPDESGNIVISESSDLILDLDTITSPDFTFAQDLIANTKMGCIITSRGCPARCNYCSTSHYWGQKIRVHSVERVLDDIERLISNYGIQKLFFHDDTFNLSEQRVKEICYGMIKRKFKLSWAAHGRVNPMSREMLDAMYEAGCIHVCWGIESGSATMLKLMNKKIDLEQVRLAYDLCLKYKDKMSTGAFTMVGYPGESEQTVKETCEFLKDIPLTDSPSTSILYVLPGTTIYDQLKNKMGGDEYWTKTDKIFYNTTEHNMDRLNLWAGMINNSGKKVKFDHSKHFWDGISIGNIPVSIPPKFRFQKKSQ
jgi:radical SAM superfamily enzyme YgiQ (UPF0313 family)